MTGGRIVILGKTGRNFAAGMSGGIAYVLDWDGDFSIRVNHEMVSLESVEIPGDITALKATIQQHVAHTGSSLGQYVLDHWDEVLPKFVRVMPHDYRRVLDVYEQLRFKGVQGEEAVMAAFEMNRKDLARVGGN
jgi:glutamate synthase (ferredoxin)